MALQHTDAGLRQIFPTWNAGLIAASIAVSLLGAFTSTQLMCQARVSRAMFATLVWTMLASLTFGFCSIWCLHFVAVLACELDIPIGLNVPQTVVSALLAVSFTFIALSSDFILARYRTSRKRRAHRKRAQRTIRDRDAQAASPDCEDTEHLLSYHDGAQMESPSQEQPPTSPGKFDGHDHINGSLQSSSFSSYTMAPEFSSNFEHGGEMSSLAKHVRNQAFNRENSLDQDHDDAESYTQSDGTDSRRGSVVTESDTTLSGLGRFMSLKSIKTSSMPSHNPFKVTAQLLWTGLTARNVTKGLIWSCAITLMHYLGIMSMEIPHGHSRLNPLLVALSAVISWIVCTVGCILMSSMETNIGQQLLFSVVASTGVAAMHYTGMAGTAFYTSVPPSDSRGYPPGLPIAIASIAILTCLAANGLLAHSATVARNKLAEIVRTRKRLWAAIAQKEMAEEAALAKSSFLASASHELRTPIHQLAGFTDLMARCRLPDDAQLLLFAIQDATKSLSLITNNVLDWSRLEKGEAVTRPINVDLRAVVESTVRLLPRRDDDLDVELLVVVSDRVPKSLFLDETYMSRIIMNLVSNALKFTTSGYVLLLVDVAGDGLTIKVRDSGVGIPGSFLPDLFEPFKQAQTRGAERGTGLGLSIVRQLLHKCDGEIKVESKHIDTDGVDAGACGTTFTVHVPLQDSDNAWNGNTSPPTSVDGHQLALLSRYSARMVEGLTEAWKALDIEVVPQSSIESLTSNTTVVWVDVKMLQADGVLKSRLLARTDLKVFLPYDSENELYSVLGNRHPTHFVPFRRPWKMHEILHQLSSLSDRCTKLEASNRTVRFSSDVDVLSNGSSEPLTRSVSELSTLSQSTDQSPSPGTPGSSLATVLLVEDNRINQKLGVKMLKTLGYDVLVANDGQEGIDMVLEHDRLIDVILMDQSMPRKDGLTATREIRELERNGSLQGAERWQNNPLRRNRRLIFAVTAVVGPTHEAMCKTVGTDAFLAKPLSLGKLKNTLEEYMNDDGALAVAQ